MSDQKNVLSARLDALFADVPQGEYPAVRDYLLELSYQFRERLGRHLQGPLNEQAQRFGDDTLLKKKT